MNCRRLTIDEHPEGLIDSSWLLHNERRHWSNQVIDEVTRLVMQQLRNNIPRHPVINPRPRKKIRREIDK